MVRQQVKQVWVGKDDEPNVNFVAEFLRNNGVDVDPDNRKAADPVSHSKLFRHLITLAAENIRKGDVGWILPTRDEADEEPTVVHALPQGIEEEDGKYYAIDGETGKRVQIDPEQMWFWTEEWQAGERRADENFNAGKYQTFESVEAMFKSLKQTKG